ncbi:MAG TPA: oxidoreductase, partial [Bacteroidales bacterium]|nr:oxidoreductase [Bacteroidales bacterium]
EATAVAPEGRITPWDLGLWDDGQIGPLKRITEFLRDQGSVPAIQLGHAGRKAGRSQTWLGNWRVEVSQGGWERIVAPSPVSYYPLDGAPEELTEAEISKFTDAFAGAAVRAVEAGFGIMEIHGAHGYLIHEFLSPLSNKRTDRYGGTFENRIRFLMEVIHAVRKVIPDSMPLLVRISATDWMPDEESWEPDQAV